MNRLTPSIVLNAMIETLHRRKWEPTPMVLPPSNLYHLPVRTGVTFERDNTSQFAAKFREKNAGHKKIQHVLNRRAMDCDIA